MRRAVAAVDVILGASLILEFLKVRSRPDGFYLDEESGRLKTSDQQLFNGSAGFSPRISDLQPPAEGHGRTSVVERRGGGERSSKMHRNR